MSNEIEPDQTLQKRVSRLAILVGIVMILNGVLGISFMRNLDADNERVARENAEIDARVAESKNTLAEAQELLQKANDLNERAAKIEVTLRGSKNGSK